MSTKKPRKSLDDALASEFVYGEKSEPSLDGQDVREPSQQSSPPLQPKQKPDIMTQLQATPKEPTVRITVDLSETMHRKLSLLAARTGRKKAEIIRFLLDEALKDVND